MLVILGLLVGGVLSGQSLIRAAEVRSVVTEYNKYTTAVMAFRDKYFALPGDMPNATSFWGMAAAGAACNTTVGTGTKTCNGDGDGMVAWVTNSAEDIRIWQHLVNAGLIEGNYSGVPDPIDYFKAAVNTPASKAGHGTFWDVWGTAALASDTIHFPKNAGNYLSIWSMMGELRPEEAWNVDKKMDDGKPATGKAQSIKGDVSWPCTSVAGQATTAAQDAAATYVFTSTDNICELNFSMN